MLAKLQPCCSCGRRFRPVSRRNVYCADCSDAHRRGARCRAKTCATCDRVRARLDAYNYARKHGGADKDRRRGHDVACPCGCGATYAGFRSGSSFLEARRDFIVVPEGKDGRRRHGRRNQVLGRLREWKLKAWEFMVDSHVAAKGAA